MLEQGDGTPDENFAVEVRRKRKEWGVENNLF
jgi:hypothetical protein